MSIEAWQECSMRSESCFRQGRIFHSMKQIEIYRLKIIGRMLKAMNKNLNKIISMDISCNFTKQLVIYF